MIAGNASDLLQRLGSVFDSIFSKEPKRAFVEYQASNQQHTAWHNLDSHGDTPGGCRIYIHGLVDAVIDPEANHRANLIGDFEEAREDTADRRDGELGDVTRNSRSNAATRKASKYSTGIFHSESV